MASYLGRPRHFNLADLFELVAAAVPDREAVVAGDRRCSFRTLDRRANRVANLVLSWALRPRTRVGILSSNRLEWLEVMLGSFKARATPIGLRLDASAGETRDLLDGTGAEVLVYESRFSPVVSAVAGQVPPLRHLLVLPDRGPDPHPLRDRVGATDYEVEVAVRSEAVPGVDRSPDDVYLVDDSPADGRAADRPAGSRTTAWRHEDLFLTELGGGRRAGADAPVSSPEELVEHLRRGDDPLLEAVTGSLAGWEAQRRTLSTLLAGGTVVLSPGDPGSPTGGAAVAGRRR